MKFKLKNWSAKIAKNLPQPKSWQEFAYGEAQINALSEAFAPHCSLISGYQVIKLGNLSGELALNLPMRHQILLQTEQHTSKRADFTRLLNTNDSQIIANFTKLPFLNQSINAAFLLQTLNFAQDPHQILREVQRVLADDGLLFLSLYNPLSLNAYKPRQGGYRFRLFPRWRVIDWLALLNFDVLLQQNVNPNGVTHSPFAPLSILIAQKKFSTLTLNTEKSHWHFPPIWQGVGEFKPALQTPKTANVEK